MWITAVSRIFSGSDFGRGGFQSEGWSCQFFYLPVIDKNRGRLGFVDDVSSTGIAAAKMRRGRCVATVGMIRPMESSRYEAVKRLPMMLS